LIGLKL